MIWTTLYFVQLAVLLILPPFLYKNCSTRMVRFCERMTWSNNCQTFFVRLVLIYILVFHVLYYHVHAIQPNCYVSAVIILFLFSAKNSVKLLEEIRRSRQLQFFLLLLSLASLFSSDMYTLGVTLGTLLVAAMFWPSEQVMKFNIHPQHYDSYIQLIIEMMKRYYS